jgi:hypothetical protein
MSGGNIPFSASFNLQSLGGTKQTIVTTHTLSMIGNLVDGDFEFACCLALLTVYTLICINLQAIQAKRIKAGINSTQRAKISTKRLEHE